jgi:hypothetical protein
MKIDIKLDPTSKPSINDIATGSVFAFGHLRCIKTTDMTNIYGDNCNAIDLADGKPIRFINETIIPLPTATLVLR